MLPDAMPPAFESSYTPIAAAGTEAQIRHLSRMIATQFTAMGIGPGSEEMKQEMRQNYIDRQSAKSEGAVIPPTPLHVASQMLDMPPPSSTNVPLSSSQMMHKSNDQPTLGVSQGQKAASKRFTQFGLVHITRPMDAEKLHRMLMLAYERIMNNEKRALQGGAGLSQQKILVRLASRFGGSIARVFDNMLLGYVLGDQKARGDVALLWVYEAYSQYQNYITAPVGSEKIEHLAQYDHTLCQLLENLLQRGEHKETLFHKILLEAPYITTNALHCLKRACLDKVYGAFGMTTLREMVLTRPRQRHELLSLLLEFSYYERNDLKTQSLETTKELFQLDYLKSDVKQFVGDMLDNVLLPTPPAVLFGEEQGRPVSQSQWDEPTLRACLYLYLNLLPLDQSLIHKLAQVYSQANTEVKKVILRVLEAPVKAMGMQCKAFQDLLDNCPRGAETLAARIVHLLTERSPPIRELVVRLKHLHETRNTDVRSLIPVMTGLDREEIMEALPKFVLVPSNQRAVQGVFTRLLSGKNIESGSAPMSAIELMVVLHQIETKSGEEQLSLIKSLRLLFDMRTVYTKETVAGVIQTLVELEPMPPLLMHTIIQALIYHPTLTGFVVNMFQKLVAKKIWLQPKLWEGFVKCCQKTRPHCFHVLMQYLPIDQLKQLFAASLAEGDDFKESTLLYVQSLPHHQQALIAPSVVRLLNGIEEESENALPPGEGPTSIDSLCSKVEQIPLASSEQGAAGCENVIKIEDTGRRDNSEQGSTGEEATNNDENVATP